jgi:hypothetical protein
MRRKAKPEAKPAPLDPAIYTDPDAAAAHINRLRVAGEFNLSQYHFAPSTHPAHGDRDDLPRDPDGRIPQYYYCSPEEIERYGLTPPDPTRMRRERRDGITIDKQIAFIEAPAETASVSAAATTTGLSRKSLYALRNATHAHAFRAAWDEALRSAVRVLADVAFERAVEGVREPVFGRGGEVGSRIRYNDKLLMFLLRVRDPGNFASLGELGAWKEVRPIEGVAGLDTALARLEMGDPSADAPEPSAPSPTALPAAEDRILVLPLLPSCGRERAAEPSA